MLYNNQLWIIDLKGVIIIENKILTSLPVKENGKIDYNKIVGMNIDIICYGEKYGVKILDYIKENNPPRFRTLCNNIECLVQCNSFLRGNFSGVVGYIQPSKNKFEYSREHNCWFGWTQKGEKFAFDGDDETVKFIMKHTWYVANNKIQCTKLKKSLKQVVLGLENTRRNNIIHISNDLNLLDKYFDNRKCNLSFKEWGRCSRVNKNKNNKSYKYDIEISSDEKYIIVKDNNGECFKIDNNDIILNIIYKNKCKVVYRNSGKTYVECGKTDLHREILGITDSKYSEWFVDHINGDGTDNRLENLVITNHYGNMCNQKGKGYSKTNSGGFRVQFMKDYPDDRIYNGGVKRPIFKNEQEAIEEVARRRKYILENRLYFKNKEELDEYIANDSRNQSKTEIL